MGITIFYLITILLLNGLSKEQLNNVKIYSESAIITDIDKENDIVTCKSFNGNEWQFYGCEDYFINDIVALTMCDNGTKTVEDDIICNVKYCGYLED